MTDDLKPKVVVICGPTGIGKTSVAIDLARRFGGEIVSADSMQIYRHMDIGTAKPTVEERDQVRHHLIDIVDPDEDFSAGRYAKLAFEKLSALHQRGVLPLIVGGTGLYIKACLHGLFRKRAADEAVLGRLAHEAEVQGAPALHARLAACDPQAAERINANDAFRIIRALEVYESTGKTMTAFRQEHGFSDNRYNALKICLYADRQIIYDRIDLRVDQMMARGFEGEVTRLLAMGYTDRLKSMQSLGYRHMIQYLNKTMPWPDMVTEMKRDTRRYAKRQLTWFRADPEIHWIDRGATETDIASLIETFLH